MLPKKSKPCKQASEIFGSKTILLVRVATSILLNRTVTITPGRSHFKAGFEFLYLKEFELFFFSEFVELVLHFKILHGYQKFN